MSGEALSLDNFGGRLVIDSLSSRGLEGREGSRREGKEEKRDIKERRERREIEKRRERRKNDERERVRKRGKRKIKGRGGKKRGEEKTEKSAATLRPPFRIHPSSTPIVCYLLDLATTVRCYEALKLDHCFQYLSYFLIFGLSDRCLSFLSLCLYKCSQ